MPITPIEANYDNSPWYSKMETNGKLWNRLAEEIGAQIQGQYNAYLFEFSLTKVTSSFTLKINGRRQLTTTDYQGQITEVFHMQVLTKASKNAHLKVGKPELINFLLNLYCSYKHSDKINGYKLHYNNPQTLEILIKSQLLFLSNLTRLKISDKGLSLKMFELPTKEEVRRLIDFCENLLCISISHP
jgi:hypothetical protein